MAGSLQLVHTYIENALIQGSLLLRFYDPTSGKITLNGIDIREYNVKQVSLFNIGLSF